MTENNPNNNAATVVASAVEKTAPPKRPFWRKKRWWILAAAVFAVIWITLMPAWYRPKKVELPVSCELVREPNGEINYYQTFEQTQKERLADPEKNGFREVLAALGPRVLEQAALADKYTDNWGGIKTSEEGASWWNGSWVPLCQRLEIDPDQRPRLVDYVDAHAWLLRNGVTGEEPIRQEARNDGAYPAERLDWDEVQAVYTRCKNKPWTEADAPQLARWVEESAPYFDLYTEAVKKPEFTSWYRGEVEPVSDDPLHEVSLFRVLLPDVQAQRSFARDAALRVMYRIAHGDNKGAAEDIFTTLRLGRHLQRHDFIVSNLVGIAIENIAIHSACRWLQYAEPTRAELDAFLAEWDALVNERHLANIADVETLIIGSALKDTFYPKRCSGIEKPHFTAAGRMAVLNYLSMEEEENHSFGQLLLLAMPFDKTAAYAEVIQASQKWREAFDEPTERKIYDKIKTWTESFAASDNKSAKDTGYASRSAFSLLTPQARGAWLAGEINRRLCPERDTFMAAFLRIDSLRVMFRLALTLEQYRLDKGDYPERLDALVPDYVTEIPLDPVTDRATFVYRYLSPTRGVVYQDADGKALMSQADKADAANADATNADVTNNDAAKTQGRYLLYSTYFDDKDDGGAEDNSLRNRKRELDLPLPRWIP